MPAPPSAPILRGIPTSRAYWELRAEQMMNRVFEPEPTIDLEGESGQPRLPGGDPPAGEPAASRKQRPVKGSDPTTGRPSRQPVLLLTTLGGVCMVSAASTLLYLNHWNQAQQTLQQERNLLLVERLRQLGPANPVPATPPHSSQMQGSGQSPQVALLPSAEQLPPPPEEPWMQELDQLPPAVAPSQPAIQVPVSPSLPAARPAPAPLPAPAPAPSASSGPSPQLVGVVGAKGQAGSAIFQIGNSSTSATVGESIGGTGWRLRSADGDSAVIERGGERRRISIGNGQ